MGFWSFFRRRGEEAEPRAPEPVEARAPAPPPGPPDDVARLARVGLAGGPDGPEALALFGALRRTPDEARAVGELARAARQRKLPEAVLLALAAALLDRGEPEAAQRVLQTATSSPALVMLADIEERRGELPAALSLVERVLLRDLDHPGARERHQRWRAQLGYEAPLAKGAPGATVVTRKPEAPYDLLREIGRGGAGAVYEAVDRELGRRVALKVYHQPERDRAQLAHEAKVAVALEGPRIVRVFDLDPDHGWLALEYADEATVREQIRGKNLALLLPVERWAEPLAEALARVHAASWVHHDVKPANVLLDRDGKAILTDFGTARRRGEPSPPGSLGYVSPERMKGRASDPRDDVYGFGRVLEDVLDVITDEAIAGRYRPLAQACTGPDAARPEDGQALLAALRAR